MDAKILWCLFVGGFIHDSRHIPNGEVGSGNDLVLLERDCVFSNFVILVQYRLEC